VRVYVVANEGDACADRVVSRAQARGHQAERRSLRPLVTQQPFCWPAVPVGDGEPPPDAVLVRQYPSATALLGPPEQLQSYQQHFTEQQAQRDRHIVATSLLAAWQLGGARLVNPIQSRPFDDKPAQLAALARAGVAVPRTLVTNDPSAIDAFAETGGPEQVVVKPIDGGQFARSWRSFESDERAQLSRAPVLVQERVAGLDLRVTVVDGVVVSAVSIASASLDYRADARFVAGQPVLSEYRLDESEQALFSRAAACCHQLLSGIDAKRTPTGGLVVFECNSAPVFLEAEDLFGHRISDAIVDALAASRQS
jgi:glutathione synthase/RimK-type ligase-like ATP-grasp enzyme